MLSFWRVWGGPLIGPPLNKCKFLANVSFSSLDKRKCVQKIFWISLRIKFCKIIINKNVVYHLNYQRQIKFTKKSWLEQKKFLIINISTANHVHENLLNRIVDIWDHLTLGINLIGHLRSFNPWYTMQLSVELIAATSGGNQLNA